MDMLAAIWTFTVIIYNIGANNLSMLCIARTAIFLPLQNSSVTGLQ